MYAGSRLTPNSMTLNAIIGGFIDFFWQIWAVTQVYIIHKVEPRNYRYVYFGMTVRKVLYFIPNSCKSNSNSDRNFCLWFLCIVSRIIYYLVHLSCTVFHETACIPYSIFCDILFDGAAISGIGLRRPALTNADWLYWLTCYIFTRESSYCFHRVLAIAILSVRPSHGWNKIGPRLLLITNKKFYTGSRLAPNSMTLNDLERQNTGFYRFFGDFKLRH